MPTLILEVVLGHRNFLPAPAILGVSPWKKRGYEPLVQGQTSPEINRKGVSTFSTMRALSSPRLCQIYDQS